MSKPNLPPLPTELESVRVSVDNLSTYREARDCYYTMDQMYAYAEEAVRQALAAQAWKVEPEESFDHMRPNLDRGIPGSFKAFSHWVMNHPDDRIYVHSAQEGFYAGIEWCQQQRADHIPETRDG